MIHFDLPKEKSSIIKVIGVGGGGSNAVNHMFSQNIEGVNFIICNTDAQAIATSRVPNKVQLGPHLTQGLGAGANPDIGRQATEESLEEIKQILEVNTKMAFITAGMGGGTGTGGAPIISKICKDLGILTVGIITTPFSYEGKKRQQQAEEGIRVMKQYVDTLLVISNDKLRHQFGNLKMKEAFAKADNILATAAKCITDVINSPGQINVDFDLAGTVDHIRDTFGGCCEDIVRFGEGLLHLEVAELMTQFIVADHQQGVDIALHDADAFLGLLLTFPTFVGERCRDDAHSKDTEILAYLGDNRCAAGTGTATHAGRNKGHLGIHFEDAFDLLQTFFRRLPAD